MANDIWHLGRIDWLRGLPEEQLSGLRSAASLRTYEPGEMIFGPDRNPSFVYVLELGLVRIFRVSTSGGEIEFGRVRPGEVFGELALFVDKPRESFAQAVERSTVWRITRDQFLRVLRSSPSVLFEVSRQMGGRFKKVESRVEDLVFRTARSRVARMLLQLADEFGAESPRGVAISIPLTQSELAVLVGATRQTVNGSLSQLRAEGLVDYEGSRFTLLDRDALGLAADGPEL
jgi:CRP-like cAMP-binding protein